MTLRERILNLMCGETDSLADAQRITDDVMGLITNANDVFPFDAGRRYRFTLGPWTYVVNSVAKKDDEIIVVAKREAHA